MQEIQGKAKTVRELLKGVKYSIDYYQREYKWKGKQIRELTEDLAGKLLDDYQAGQSRAVDRRLIISRHDIKYAVSRTIHVRSYI